MRFNTGYHNNMDREYYEEAIEEPGDKSLEEPIIPINELGATVPETDPATGKHILQNVESTIRQGASKMQIVFGKSSKQGMGGGPRSYGKDVREALKKMAETNEIEITGVELATSDVNNLSGFDPQRGMNEKMRQQNLHEVRDAVDFVAETTKGGGVDLWSQEFHRNIQDANWNQEGEWKDKFVENDINNYNGEKKQDESRTYLVDERTGDVIETIRHDTKIQTPKYKKAKDVEEEYGGDIIGRYDEQKGGRIEEDDLVDIEGNWIDPTDKDQLIKRLPKWDEEESRFEVEKLDWEDIKERTEEYNKEYRKDKRPLTPEEYAFQKKTETKLMQQRGQSLYYSKQYEDKKKALKTLLDKKEYYEEIEEGKSEEELERMKKEDNTLRRLTGGFAAPERMKPSEMINKKIRDLKHDLRHVHESAAANDAQAEETLELIENTNTLQKYALDKSVEGYSDMGIYAMDRTREKNTADPVHIGPEIGWPKAYGGHPEEFIELIKKSRDEMTEKLVKERDFSEEEAEQKAKKHIKGMLDTGHMGMWLNHFKKKHPRESEESRRKRFKKWYMDMVDKLQEEDVLGGVQAVDSASGAHGHLPPGQGILPVVESVKRLKEKGFDGEIISEGHEEEKFNKGRILTETWKAFGGRVGSPYSFGGPTRSHHVHQGYMGATASPTYIFGQNYVPINDYQLWSEVPFE